MTADGGPRRSHMTAAGGRPRRERAAAGGRGGGEGRVRGWGAAVHPGGPRFLVRHAQMAPPPGAAPAAAGQVQVSVEAALAALDPDRWGLVVADHRPRPTAGTGVDALI